MARPKKNVQQWNTALSAIPKGRLITIKSVTGIECTAVVPKGNRVLKASGRATVKRIHARRMHGKKNSGDIHVIAWR